MLEVALAVTSLQPPRPISPDEGLIDGRRRNDDDLASAQNLLERPGVVVSVAVGEDYADYHVGTYALALEGGS